MINLKNVPFFDIKFEEEMVEQIIKSNDLSELELSIMKEHLIDIKKELKSRVTINKSLTTSLAILQASNIDSSWI